MIITRTPFRISFFGGGTDYPVWYKENGGAVLSTTIDKYCYLNCRYFPPYFDTKHRVVWSKIEHVDDIDDIEHPSVREVLKYLNVSSGVEIHHSADLPARAGMGSSSSFTVGLLHALSVLKGDEIGKKKLLLDAIHIEQNLMKESVGSQDQSAAAFGGLNKIIFGGDEEVVVNPIDVSPERLSQLQDSLMLFFTGFSRTASEIAAEQIKNTPKKGTELRAMAGMVDEAVDILQDPKREIDDFGRLLHETWRLKRGLTSNISTPQVDEIYAKAKKAGALGGKLLGAGGGGFMLLYVKFEDQAKVKEALKNLVHVPFKFEGFGSQVIYRQSY